MSRTSTLTLGFLLLLVGIKLNVIQSYQLTPSATRFWIERIEDPEVVMRNNLYQYTQPNAYNGNNVFQQASYANVASPALPQKVLTPPTWICWPVFFLGAFLLLNGLAMPKD